MTKKVKRTKDVSSTGRFESMFTCSCYVDVWNETCTFTGDGDKYDYGAFIQNYVNSNVHPDDCREFEKKTSMDYMLAHLSEDESFYVFDFRRKFNETYRWNRIHVLVASWGNRVPDAIILANMDIDEAKQKEYAYQEKLKQANKAKSEFLSNVSHDIRTPMNAIMGFISLLEHDADDPVKVRADVRKLKASGNHLLSLINDVLDMNKIENQVVTISNSEFELSSCLSDFNTIMSQLTKDKKQNFKMELHNVTNNRIVGDKIRLTQILMNILSNAVKYTPESGDIRFDVYQFRNESKVCLRFEISDNGIGMTSEFLEKIYEPFARETDRIPPDVSGTGLGMAITKNLVELMDGEINIESKPDKGSKFIVDINFGTVSDSSLENGKDDASDKNKSLKGMNFLIAEDNATNGEIISKLLEIEGADSTLCTNGKEAVDMFINSPKGTFDMILMDVRMPVMNGYEAAKAIRKSNAHDAGEIPIISMTANAFSEDIMMAKMSGMNGHIPKPIDIDTLKSTIRKNRKNL